MGDKRGYMTNSRLKLLGFYVPFNSQGHVGIGPHHCHLWESSQHRADSL